MPHGLGGTAHRTAHDHGRTARARAAKAHRRMRRVGPAHRDVVDLKAERVGCDLAAENGAGRAVRSSPARRWFRPGGNGSLVLKNAYNDNLPKRLELVEDVHEEAHTAVFLVVLLWRGAVGEGQTEQGSAVDAQEPGEVPA